MRCEREVREPALVALDERDLAEDEALLDRVERRLPEAVLLRERAVEARRVRAVALARRVRERAVETLVPRLELLWRGLPLVVRVVDARAERDLLLRLLVAMV